jgi:rubrerythrin
MIFNADEVLEMAAQIERNGATFYRRAAEVAGGGKDLLLEIAEQEDEHLALFESMRANLPADDAASTTFDPEGLASTYLKAMADGHVFDLAAEDSSSLVSGNETLDEILATAIQAEKDTIAFFAGMKGFVPESLGKDKVDDLISEEVRHISWLVGKKTG